MNNSNSSGGSQAVTVTNGGIAATLDPPPSGAHAVAPTSADGYNTLAQPIQAVASWRIDSHRFDVGSSFILPNSVDEFSLLAQLRAPAAPGEPEIGAKLAIFGHADPTGTDEANKALAGRRARSVYALLVRDVAAWEALHANPVHSDCWGPRMLRIALAALGYPSGAVSNEWTDRGSDALRDFQSARGLSATGQEDGDTRRALFTTYMDAICSTSAGPLVYARAAFLLNGTDSGGKAAYQGCGEVNPLVVPSQKRLETLQRPENRALRDEAYRNNRRVVIYMLPQSLKVSADRWPCPRASESGDGCRDSFWADGEDRRQAQDRPREHALHDGTFACRFYDRLARFSPSERTRYTVPVYLLDHRRRRMPSTAFRATFDGASVDGMADADGKALIEGAFVSGSLTLQWAPLSGAPNSFLYTSNLTLDAEDEPSDDDDRAALRLRNMGYHRGNFAANVRAFQIDHGLDPNPWPDSDTRALLYSSHLRGLEPSVELGPGQGSDPTAHDEPLGKDLLR